MYFSISLLPLGGAFRSVDVHARLPGLPEEERVHLQHAHGEAGASAEAGPAARGPDGGEGAARERRSSPSPVSSITIAVFDLSWRLWQHSRSLNTPYSSRKLICSISSLTGSVELSV